MISGILTFIPNLALNVKRCHDRNKTGWFVLISVIPILGWIWYTVEIWFLEGTDAENRFGRPPAKFQPVDWGVIPLLAAFLLASSVILMVTKSILENYRWW